MEVYAGALFQHYSHAENEGMAWDSEDGCYVGTTYTTEDVVRDEIGEPSSNERVIEAIIKSLGDHEWCDRSPYHLNEFERHHYGWEQFCNTVKHSARYFFDAVDDPDDDAISVSSMLDPLSDITSEAGLIVTLPIGTEFHRVRVHSREEV